ncbi:MAG: ABC transporter substrate-binding protein [Bacteroidales bacterium]|nr:ABC transporter substrate-binding protein [Bacteroidales bacterium]
MNKLFPYFIYVSITIGILVFYTSCYEETPHYKIAISDASTSLHHVGLPLVKLLEKEMNVQFDIVDTTSGSVEHIRLLSEGKVDFAIALTTAGNEELKNTNYYNIRTVSPLYNQILFIIYNDSLKPENLKDLICGRKIGLGVEKGGTAQFTQKILSEFGIDTSDYISVYTKNSNNVCSDKIDVSCSFTSFNNPRIIKMLNKKDLRLFSLGNVDYAYRGSSVDGICKKLWTAKPLIIPKNTYYSKPQKPVLTVSVFTSLLCNKNISADFIQQLTEILIQKNSNLIRENPVINQISEKNLQKIHYYPLHEGVHLFLDRYQPSFLERYAESIALFLSIAIILSGIISSYRKWNKQRKKDRIDVYYEEVLRIDEINKNTRDTNVLKENLEKLYNIRNKAFENLIKEKLSADESFRIFTSLTAEAIQRINKKLG